MFEKEVVSHNTDAQNRVQAKSNSCYLKQNKPAPFNKKQKNIWSLRFFEVYLEPMLTLPSAMGWTPVVWSGTHLGRGSIILYQVAAYAALLVSVGSKMVVLCLKPGQELWINVKVWLKLLKTHSDSGSTQLYDLNNIRCATMSIMSQYN